MSKIKSKFAPDLVPFTAVGQAGGVAGLNGSGKLDLAVFPSGAIGGVVYRGTFDASTGTYPANPANGDIYRVTVGGTVSGTALSPGDYIFYSATEAQWDVVNNASTTDEVAEGSNLYFQPARAQAAAVVNSLSGSQTNQAPSVSSVSSALSAKQSTITPVAPVKVTLAAGDITNGYIVLGFVSWGILKVSVKGLGPINRSPADAANDTDADFYVSTDGTSGNSKVTWINDLSSGGATPLAAGDVIFVEGYHI